MSVEEKIRTIIDEKCDGNVATFANEIGFTRQQVYNWLEGDVLTISTKAKERIEERWPEYNGIWWWLNLDNTKHVETFDEVRRMEFDLTKPIIIYPSHIGFKVSQ